jgi:hypothetical protein
VFLGGFSFANRIDDRTAWAASLKYFNLGEIQLTDDFGGDQGIEKLNEFSVDGSYALKLSETYAMGVTLRYIRSDLGIKSGNTTINPENSVMAILTVFGEVVSIFQTLGLRFPIPMTGRKILFRQI